ncbi:bifunctional hydroxymethylpyrimidine kinase/phosphomethylpyrimidine kinase [Shigella flexneri]
MLKRWQNSNVIKSKTWYSTLLCWQKRRSATSPLAVATLRSRLLPQVSLITPNLPEAAALLDAPHARNERKCWNKAIGCWRWAVAQC